MGLLQQFRSLFATTKSDALLPRRLDGRSKVLLDASFRMLPRGERGWIAIKEAAVLFSPKADEYAFGELDEEGKSNLASFAAQASMRFAFMPVEGRLYFIWEQ
jgi:hypothetical protein